jgi:hypothetical protein
LRGLTSFDALADADRREFVVYRLFDFVCTVQLLFDLVSQSVHFFLFPEELSKVVELYNSFNFISNSTATCSFVISQLTNLFFCVLEIDNSQLTTTCSLAISQLTMTCSFAISQSTTIDCDLFFCDFSIDNDLFLFFRDYVFAISP